MTFEEFKDYYKKYGKCPNDAFERKNPYTPKQFRTRYEKYMKKYNNEGKTKNQVLREKALERDKHCQLLYKLSVLAQKEIRQQIFGDLNHLDMAHVFNKSSYPHLRYDIDNVVMIKRIFHNRLDTQCDPVTGKRISKEELEKWWKIIIGVNRYETLKAK